MNKKYLFGMLVSGVMLAACTADDDFSTATKVTQKANPSAPVFTVYFDGEDQQNRAYLNDAWNVGFNDGKQNLLSFYHGVQPVSGEEETTALNSYLADTDTKIPHYEFQDWRDHAIYEGKYNEETGKYEFTTNSMIYAGGAVLIWPADTAFAYRPGQTPTEGSTKYSPMLRIKQHQSKETRAMVPYMSEILTINDYPENGYDGKDPNVEGYGRKYDVALKRVGSTLLLNLSKKNNTTIDNAIKTAGATELDFKKVVLKNSASTDNEVFTIAMGVNSSDYMPVARQYNNSTKAYDHDSWKNQSTINKGKSSKTLVAVDSLTTTDIDNNVAIFTLLPSRNLESASDPSTNKTAYFANNANAEVWAYTNYGYVKLTTNTSNKPDDVWEQGSSKMTIKAGLEGLLSDAALWNYTLQTNSPFYYALDPTQSENVGGLLRRTLNVDLNNLEMNNLHIKDQKHLRDAIAVYNAMGLRNKKNINFILDGDEDGRFEMDDTTLGIVMTELGKNGNPNLSVHNLTFQPCSVDEEQCDIVRLVHEGDGKEIPAVKFVEASDNHELSVELVGKWAFTDNKDKTTDSDDKDIQGVKVLIVNGDDDAKGTLELSGYVHGKNSDLTDLVVKKGGTVNILDEKTAYVRLSINNHGTINIGKKATLSNDGTSRTVKFFNREAQGEKATGWDKGGVINVDDLGQLTTTQNAGGVIYNYGEINQLTSKARVNITRNASRWYSLILQDEFKNVDGKLILEGNETIYAAGTINLAEATPTSGEYRVQITEGDLTYTDTEGKKFNGFIKVKVSTPNAESKAYGTIANYVELTGNCSSIRKSHTVTADGQETTVTDLPENIKYIEVNTTTDEVSFIGTISVDGLFVRANNWVSVGTGSSLTVTKNVYVTETGSRINYSGKYTDTGATYKGYFGGKETDGKQGGNVFEN